MSDSTAVAVSSAAASGRGSAALLGGAALAALLFVALAALPYFLRVDEAQFRQYWPMRGWLLVHVTMGMVALLVGPVQLWIGLTDRWSGLHRKLGIAYMLAIIASAAAAYYLAFHTSGGVVFGAGLVALATAWLTTTGLAYLAIRRHLYEQHKEWMVRSYVVTFGFVTFRIAEPLLRRGGISPLDAIGIAAWACWALPLLANEAVMQGRKVLRVRL